MLTPLLLCLSLTPLGRAAAPVEPLGLLPDPRQRGAAVACDHPKWLSRKKIPKQLNELGGYPLYEAYLASLQWLATQVDDQGGARGEGDRDVGTTATLALVMLGTGSNVNAGFGMRSLRRCIPALRKWQDEETGELGDPERPEYLLDQTLAVLALSEANFSDQIVAQEVASRKAAGALLAARGEDGLWHIDAEPDSAVDSLVTSLAAYALFIAREAEVEIPDEVFGHILAWTQTVAAQAVDSPVAELGREEALGMAYALCARVFSAAALRRSLADDEAVTVLTERVAAQVPEPPEPGTEWTAPARLAEPDFAFLATLGLFQTDNQAWGRCSQWLALMLQDDVGRENDPAGSLPDGETGRLPGGRLGSTMLRVLALQNGVRELNVGVLVH